MSETVCLCPPISWCVSRTCVSHARARLVYKYVYVCRYMCICNLGMCHTLVSHTHTPRWRDRDCKVCVCMCVCVPLICVCMCASDPPPRRLSILEVCVSLSVCLLCVLCALWCVCHVSLSLSRARALSLSLCDATSRVCSVSREGKKREKARRTLLLSLRELAASLPTWLNAHQSSKAVGTWR